MNHYARQVRQAILEKLPQLASCIRDGPEGSLSIQVPHPRIPTGLLISTKGNEITIGFRQWHTHGDMLGGDSVEEQVEAALNFVREILGDERQLVVSYVDGAFEDAWVSEDPVKDQKYCGPREELMVGTWSSLARQTGTDANAR